MKLHWRTRNRLVALKWKLMRPVHAVKMLYRRWVCHLWGHLEFHDCDRVYCTCCHQWKNRETGAWS